MTRRTVTRFADTRKTVSFDPVSIPDASDVRSSLGDYVPMSSVASRAPAALSAVNRMDPYYSRMWDRANAATWSSASQMVSDINRGVEPRVERLEQVRVPAPVDRLWTDAAMRQMAAALMWRTVTSDQMAAISGVHSWLRMRGGGRPVGADRLWSHDLLRVGRLSAPWRVPVPSLVRPGQLSKFDVPGQPLSMAQWLAVTGGVSPKVPAPYHRHDVLSAELALRVAEFADPVGVLGESVCSVAAMTGTGVLGPDDRRRSDACIIRSDGVRIAIEMTTSTASLKSKVDRWVETLKADSSRGTAVVFVTSTYGGWRGGHTAMSARSMVAARVLNDVDAQVLGVASRVFVVDWTDWFGPGMSLVEDFDRLPVKALTRGKRAFDGNPTWRTVYVGDPSATPWEPVDVVATARMVECAHGLLGMPQWLRDARVDGPLARRVGLGVLREAGWVRETLPVPDFARPSPGGPSRIPDGVIDECWRVGAVTPRVTPRSMFHSMEASVSA